MNMTLEQLTEMALSLSAAEREMLAERLVQSLDPETMNAATAAVDDATKAVQRVDEEGEAMVRWLADR